MDQIKRLPDILKEKKVLVSGLSVQTIGLKIKMEVMGFIPCYSNDVFSGKVNGRYFPNLKKDFTIGMDKIKFQVEELIDAIKGMYSKQPTNNGKLPTISTNNKSILLPICRRIEIGNNLPIRLNSLIDIYDSVTPNVESCAKEVKERIANNNSGYNYDAEKNEMTYTPSEEDFLLYRWQDEAQMPNVIAGDYYCLCSYINTVTGVIDYYVYSPYDLVIMPNSL